MIYLDNAATTSPKPQSVINSVSNAMRKYSINSGRGGYKTARDTEEMIYSVRDTVATFLDAESAENVVFTQNCTTALNIALFGLLKSGDHVVISPFEHNAVLRPLNQLAQIGVEYTIADCVADMDNCKKAFERCIRKNTVAVVCTHASNVCGAVLPLSELSDLCREYGLHFIVDGAQTAGILPISVQKSKIDCLAVATHKGLYAPTGTGLLVTDSTPNPLIYGGTGGDSMSPTQPKEIPERYESGTLNPVMIAGIGAGVKFVSPMQEQIYKHEMRLLKIVENEFKKNSSIKTYTIPNAKIVPVLSFNVEDKTSSEVAMLLDRYGIAVRAGLHCAPLAHKTLGTLDRGTVRFAPSVFTTDSEIEYFLKCISKISK